MPVTSLRPGLLKYIGFYGYVSAERSIVGEDQQRRHAHSGRKNPHRDGGSTSIGPIDSWEIDSISDGG
jgi:hypothetical protein